MVTKDRPIDRLTSRQRLFAEAVAQGKDHSTAARLAGYTGDSIRTAPRIAQTPHVQAAISRARTAIEEAQEFTLDWWRRELRKTYSKAERADDTANALRALELAGRHLGALDPQTPLHPAAQALMDALTEAMQQRALPTVNTRVGAHAREDIVIEARITDATGANGAENGETGAGQ